MSPLTPSLVKRASAVVERQAEAGATYVEPRVLCGDQSLVEALECARDSRLPFSFLVLEIEDVGAGGTAVAPEDLWRASLELVQPIRASIRGSDAVVLTAPGRLALVLRGARRDHARLVGERVMTRLLAAVRTAPVQRQLALNAGTASWPDDARCVTDLVSRAAEALWEARQSGTGRVWSFARRPRVPLACPVYVAPRLSWPVGCTRDLSLTGLYLETAADLGVGAKISLQFALPGAGNVEIVGHVARHEEQGLGLGLGIHFAQGQEIAIETIRQFLDGTD